jgi:hypothetical protein
MESIGFIFYLPHMEYEGRFGFVSRKMKKKIIADLHVLELFMAKKLDLSEKKISFCHAASLKNSCRRFFVYGT